MDKLQTSRNTNLNTNKDIQCLQTTGSNKSAIIPVKSVEKLRVAQRALRRRMLGTNLKHQVVIRYKTKLTSNKWQSQNEAGKAKNNKKESGHPRNYFGLIINFLRFCNLLKLFINFQLALLLLL